VVTLPTVLVLWSVTGFRQVYVFTLAQLSHVIRLIVCIHII